MEMHFNGSETMTNNPGQIIQLKVACIQRQIHLFLYYVVWIVEGELVWFLKQIRQHRASTIAVLIVFSVLKSLVGNERLISILDVNWYQWNCLTFEITLIQSRIKNRIYGPCMQFQEVVEHKVNEHMIFIYKSGFSSFFILSNNWSK